MVNIKHVKRAEFIRIKGRPIDEIRLRLEFERSVFDEPLKELRGLDALDAYGVMRKSGRA